MFESFRKSRRMQGAAFAAALVVSTTAAMAGGLRINLRQVISEFIAERGAPEIVIVPGPAPTTAVDWPVVPPTTETSPSLVEQSMQSVVDRVQLPAIASEFDVNKLLVPSWGTGLPAPSGVPDVIGAFRFICTASHEAKDDPVVFPGQPGKSHLHEFFGNTDVNAFSTYESLRKTGKSTCNNELNRSAYWMPAMMNGKGKVVRPDYVSIYYKRFPETDPMCSKVAVACVNLPRGLRFVFGYNMSNPDAAPTGSAYFNCDGPTATPGHYRDLVTAARFCPAGNQLHASITAPSCWDGKNLDSSDHRSHVAYPATGERGLHGCPATHPYLIPTFTMTAAYTTDADLDHSGQWSPGKPTWHLSSDEMPGMPMMTPGSTFHSDWFGAWDDTAMKMWTDNCINKLLNCSGGDLGNGKQLAMFSGFSWNANPRVVDPPK